MAIRIILTKEASRKSTDPGLDRILHAAVRHDFPVNMRCLGFRSLPVVRIPTQVGHPFRFEVGHPDLPHASG